jgi:dTDP-4-amino-4,6-dideoxygalactose transaminase
MYKGRMVGSIGDIGAWSFCQDKIMTTGGEGGMVTTNSPEFLSSMWSCKDHGKSWAAVYERIHPPGFRWLHESFGSNWRMLEMQAAIGRIQLRLLPEWTRKRQAVSARIEAVCRQFDGLRVTTPPESVQHAYYKYYVFVRPEMLQADWTRDRIVSEIVAAGVPCYQGSCSEVYLERAFVDAGLSPAKRLPVAAELGDTSLMFLVHPTLTEAEITRTCEVAHAVFSRAFRRKSQ